MEERNLPELYPGWSTVRLSGHSSSGPIYELAPQNGGSGLASALLISVPQNKAELDRMRTQGMNDLDITLDLQKQVSDILQTYNARKSLGDVPGIVQFTNYQPPKRHQDAPGWDVVILMEPVEPLTDHLNLVRSEEQILHFGKQIAAALASAQRYGLSMGGITPEHIYVAADGSFKLCSFNRSYAGPSSGTASLGLMLYWLLSGQRGSIPTSGAKLRPLTNGSEELKKVVMQACEAKGETGFHSAQELLDALNAVGTAPVPPITTVPDSDEKKQSNASSGSSHQQKDTGSKKPLLIVAIIAAAVLLLFLLLRSCTGDAGIVQTEPTETTAPVSADGWSEWMEQLPDFVTTEEYMVQEQPLYRTSALETTSSVTETVMDGWTFVETVDELGEFDVWSEWSDVVPETVPDREIETETRYRTQIKETQTSSNSTMDGWTHYDTTKERTNFGSWSDWSTNEQTSSDTRDAESKKQYRYRELEYTSSTDSNLSGWTQYDSKSEYGAWGGWSEWSDTPVDETDTREVQTRQVEVPGKTTYIYGAYFSSNSPNVNSGFSSPCGTCAAGLYGGTWTYKTITTSSPITPVSVSSSWKCSHQGTVSVRYKASSGLVYYYEKVNIEPTTYKTQYSYRTRSKTTTYYYYQWGEWSSWSDSKATESSERKVESRTVYRSRSCVTNYTYYFYRWTDWSDWTAQAATENSSTKVEQKPFYRYRDRLIVPTHYFQRWSEWGDFTTEYAAPSDVLHVESKLQLRYRLRTTEDAQTQEWTLTDVPVDSEHYEAVKWVIDRGITKGTSDTTFSPNGTFTRRQMAIMFWRAMGYPEPQNAETALTDVTLADPYRKAIFWALETGIAGLETADTFGSDTLCTRSDFISALYQLAGSPAVTLAQEPFADVDADMPFYNAVLWAYERGISNGLSVTEFGVNQPCERLQAATMIYKVLNNAPAES